MVTLLNDGLPHFIHSEEHQRLLVFLVRDGAVQPDLIVHEDGVTPAVENS